MGYFNDRLREVALEALAKFELAEDRIGIPGWSGEHERFLNFCLNEKILSTEDFENAVEVRIRQLGRKSYEGHVDARMPADHTLSPQALAYAIRMGELTDAEVDRIKFDHGDTRYTFFRNIEDSLVAKVTEQLRHRPIRQAA